MPVPRTMATQDGTHRASTLLFEEKVQRQNGRSPQSLSLHSLRMEDRVASVNAHQFLRRRSPDAPEKPSHRRKIFEASRLRKSLKLQNLSKP